MLIINNVSFVFSKILCICIFVCFEINMLWYVCKNNEKIRNKGVLYIRYFIEIEIKNNDMDNLFYNIYNVIK